MNKEEVIKELMSDSRKVVFGDDENDCDDIYYHKVTE